VPYQLIVILNIYQRNRCQAQFHLPERQRPSLREAGARFEALEPTLYFGGKNLDAKLGSGRMQAQCWLAAGSRSSRPLIGTTPVPQSAAAARFLHPPLSSRTARFPRSGWKRRHLLMEPSRRARSLSDGAHALRPCGLLHASSGWMASNSPDTVFRLGLSLQTVFTQGSFALEALPSLIATTSPCADPDASRLHFVLCTYRRRPYRLHYPRLVIGTVPLWSVLLSWSAAPSIPAVRRVRLTSSSSSTSAFASLRWLGFSARVPTKRFLVGLPFRYGRHSFMLRPPVCLPS
jgi:hypothetical protein